eukprot:TRINITY_DN17097_c0_g1_i2.p1 TRINITY_DN17097_c0_g1~~TRINITY_DN17097_c0_g1_i2.p1  ORF type:complete len:340 (+),score=107.36 TRINITY_DN17097_c0_g1_i2:86-1105(+)
MRRCIALLAQPAKQSAKRDTLKAILEASSVDAVLSHTPLGGTSEEVFVAAVNQCTALCEFTEVDPSLQSDVVDTLLGRLEGSGGTLSDKGYKAALKGYIQTGCPGRAKPMFECIGKPDGSDVAAALMSAGATGDADFADDLWKLCLSSGLLDVDNQEMSEPFARHYLAAQLHATPPRVQRFSAMSSNLSQLGIPLTSVSVSLLLKVASTLRALRAVHDTYLKPAADAVTTETPADDLADLSEMYGTYIFCLLTRGAPVKAVGVYLEASQGGLSALPMHCGAVEGYLMLLYAWCHGRLELSPEKVSELKGQCEAALCRAEDADASDDWVQRAGDALRNVP